MPRRKNNNDEKPRKRKRRNGEKLGELILFALVIFCFYCILSLFDSAFTGENGREFGEYLRRVWGGAVLVIFLFLLYLCAAKFLKLRVPKVKRQFLGTIQLYISFAFMLGFLRETGFNSNWTLFQPGNIGSILARFFILNVGTFITLLLVIASFIFSAYLFGSKILKISISSEKLIKSRRRSRNNNNEAFEETRPEDILFPKQMPSLRSRRSRNNLDDTMQFSEAFPLLSALNAHAELEAMKIPEPILKPGEPSVKSSDSEAEIESEIESEKSTMKNAINMFSDIITSIEAGEMTAPEKKQTPVKQIKKIRRPLPFVSILGSNESESESEKISDNDSNLKSENDEYSPFPPPLDIFGVKEAIDTDKNLMKSSEKQGKQIISALKNFGINASIAHIINAASVTQYQLELAPGTKINKILELADDLAMNLAVMSVRITPIWRTHYVGVEVPVSDSERKIIPLRNILDSDEFIDTRAKLPLPLGLTIDGKIFIQGLEAMPHILISGSSGSGKSVFLNSCILGICSRLRPEEVKLLMIDTRQTDFEVYESLPHLISNPVYDVKTALKALNWVLQEMESRTEKFSAAKVRNLTDYNRKNKKLPRIVIIVNELADLMYSAGSETENLITRLAQRAGASGIYMMLATQSPAGDVATNLIKSNIPARAAFNLQSVSESKNIIDSPGAEKLTGKGDMLFKSSGYPLPSRLQAPFISDEKVSDFVEYLSANLSRPEIITF